MSVVACSCLHIGCKMIVGRKMICDFVVPGSALALQDKFTRSPASGAEDWALQRRLR